MTRSNPSPIFSTTHTSSSGISTVGLSSGHMYGNGPIDYHDNYTISVTGDVHLGGRNILIDVGGEEKINLTLYLKLITGTYKSPYMDKCRVKGSMSIPVFSSKSCLDIGQFVGFG